MTEVWELFYDTLVNYNRTTAMNRAQLVRGEGTERLEAISDGVFAIVLTLLVLQFEVPNEPLTETESALYPYLIGIQPLILSYVLSFLVVGLYWVVHHNLFRLIERHDRILLYFNLGFLLTVSFLPFPTELLGVYGTQLAWGLYATNFAAIGLLLTGLWWYASWRGFTHERITGRAARLIAFRGLITPIIFILSIGVSVINLNAAYLTPLLIIPLQIWWARKYRLSSDDLSRIDEG